MGWGWGVGTSGVKRKWRERLLASGPVKALTLRSTLFPPKCSPQSPLSLSFIFFFFRSKTQTRCCSLSLRLLLLAVVVVAGLCWVLYWSSGYTLKAVSNILSETMVVSTTDVGRCHYSCFHFPQNLRFCSKCATTIITALLTSHCVWCGLLWCCKWSRSICFIGLIMLYNLKLPLVPIDIISKCLILIPISEKQSVSHFTFILNVDNVKMTGNV